MSLETIDIIVVAVYLVGILIFGIWIGSREQANKKGFFLGGKKFSWLLIGTSLFATNISSVQFVGQSGLAYKIGIAAANPQLIGGICLGLSAIFFIPIYLRTGIFTIPSFLEQRFSRSTKLVYCVTIFLMGLIGIPVILYAGSLVVVQLFGLDESLLFWCSLILGLTVGLYAIVGGLASVVYTDLIQSIILLIGGLLVLILGLREVGGLGALMAATPPDHFEMILPANDDSMPFTGVATGLFFASLFWAVSNQELLQRTLGAKDPRNAQLGMLLGGFLKIVAIFVLVFPGIIALNLVPGLNPDRAYPALVQTVLPIGISGIVLAGFLAALMSSMDSSLMSMSSIFALDIYPIFDRRVSERKALLVGRIAAGILLVWGISMAPMIKHLGLIYPLVLKSGAYLMSSIGVCYVIGRFNKRVNAAGALSTMIMGCVIGVFLVVFTSVPSLKVHVPSWLLDNHFYHISAVLVLLYAIILVVGSLFARAPGPESLDFMVSPAATAEQVARVEKVGLLASFRFWLVVYVACFAVVYTIF